MGDVFAKLTTVQGLVTPLTIQRRLKTSFDSKHVKGLQTLILMRVTIFFHHCEEKWFEIIVLFVNTWTADYKYPVPDCENLLFPIQIQLS